ncbi:hypothetical protein [Kocuria carniphila]|uniref:hypothetical protein n=1 Tax=Kocuria carniphila TaxID=262208 RepID=UPI00101C226F|nr:hypothetical protein [Kocuria carniphila]
MKDRLLVTTPLFALLTLSNALHSRFSDEDRDRGDVPGWVMLTLMSAVLVAGLLLIARPALEGLFQDAINRVSGL